MEKKILKMIVLSIIIMLSLSTQVLAIQGDVEIGSTNIKVASLDEINPDDHWVPDKIENSPEFNEKAGRVLGAIRNSGVAVSVIALMIIGLRTMFGSIEEKSHYKESMPTFVIGAIIFLACTTIPDIIYKVFNT